eukprot:785533-Amphidinium_carterae.1
MVSTSVSTVSLKTERVEEARRVVDNGAWQCDDWCVTQKGVVLVFGEKCVARLLGRKKYGVLTQGWQMKRRGMRPVSKNSSRLLLHTC